MTLWSLVQVTAPLRVCFVLVLLYDVDNVCSHVDDRVLRRGLQACLLFVNAFAVLNNERFLEKCADVHHLPLASLCTSASQHLCTACSMP